MLFRVRGFDQQHETQLSNVCFNVAVAFLLATMHFEQIRCVDLRTYCTYTYRSIFCTNTLITIETTKKKRERQKTFR